MAQYGWCRSMHWGANTVKSRSSPKACLIEEQWVNWEWETDNIQSHAKAPGHGLKSHPTLVWWPGILISGGERFPGTCCIQNWNQTVNPIVVWPHARALRSAGNGLRKMGHPPIHKDPQRVKFPWTVVPKIFDTNLNSNSKYKSKTKFCRKHWKTHVFLTGLWFPKKNSGLNALQMQLHVWPDGHIHLHGNPNPYSTYNLLKRIMKHLYMPYLCIALILSPLQPILCSKWQLPRLFSEVILFHAKNLWQQCGGVDWGRWLKLKHLQKSWN